MSDPGEYDPNQHEIRRYMDLVDAFAEAKERKDYASSDKLRRELTLMQTGWSESEFIEMAETNQYRWLAVFEPAQHRAERLARRG